MKTILISSFILTISLVFGQQTSSECYVFPNYGCNFYVDQGIPIAQDTILLRSLENNIRFATRHNGSGLIDKVRSLDSSFIEKAITKVDSSITFISLIKEVTIISKSMHGGHLLSTDISYCISDSIKGNQHVFNALTTPQSIPVAPPIFFGISSTDSVDVKLEYTDGILKITESNYTSWMDHTTSVPNWGSGLTIQTTYFVKEDEYLKFIQR